MLNKLYSHTCTHLTVSVWPCNVHVHAIRDQLDVAERRHNFKVVSALPDINSTSGGSQQLGYVTVVSNLHKEHGIDAIDSWIQCTGGEEQ